MTAALTAPGQGGGWRYELEAGGVQTRGQLLCSLQLRLLLLLLLVLLLLPHRLLLLLVVGWQHQWRQRPALLLLLQLPGMLMGCSHC